MSQTRTIGRNFPRHPADFVAFDAYRTRATALRGQAKRDAALLKAVSAFVLTMVGTVALVCLVLAAPMEAPNRQAAMAQTRALSIR